jgi:MFS family permease
LQTVDAAAPAPSLSQRKRDLRTSLRLCTNDGLAAMPITIMSMPVNVVLASLYSKNLQLSETSIGVITALPFVCNFLQIFISPVLNRSVNNKTITVVGASIQLCCWAVFVLALGFLPQDAPAAAALWIAAWFFSMSLCSSVMGVAWNGWIQEWVPARLRGKYFGERNRVLQVANVAFTLLAGAVLSIWDYARHAFQLVMALGIVIRVLSIYWMWKMPTHSRLPDTRTPTDLGAQLKLLRDAPSFLLFVAFGAVWSFAANCIGPFYHVFMFNELKLSAFQVSLLAIIAAGAAALSMPGWGRLLDRYGNKGVMAVSLILWQLQNFGWCALTPTNRDWLYIMWLWGGATSAGFFLGQFTLMLKLLPIPVRNLAIGVNLAITSVAAAVAPMLGGLLISWARADFDPLTIYHAAFTIQPILGLASIWLLLRIQEPAAAPFGHVVGAMRNARTLAGLFGLGFFANYIFYRPKQVSTTPTPPPAA